VTTLAIWSTLIGSILGFRFRFIVLLPVIFLGSAGLVATSIAEGKSFLQTLSTIAVFVCLLQLGYICTALLRDAVRPADAAGRWSLLGSPKLR
jgi:drug/metabolite transporter (DMT)-like permease